jgi:hypothetical protein
MKKYIGSKNIKEYLKVKKNSKDIFIDDKKLYELYNLIKIKKIRTISDLSDSEYTIKIKTDNDKESIKKINSLEKSTILIIDKDCIRHDTIYAESSEDIK